MNIFILGGRPPTMSEDTTMGRTLIYKEIMRLITHLASSVGTKATEQGLLM